MSTLSDAQTAANYGSYDEASAIALVSIAQSLQTLARLAVANYGVCVDCHHLWTSHYDRPDLGGCHATIVSLGQARTCPCTEPRQAIA